jgi:nucleoside-diphosphate-sugar epimerase
VTHVFHLAAQAGVRRSWGREFQVYTVNNIEATQVLLEACVGRPIERLVYASSSSVYGDNAPVPMREDALPQPVSPYGVTKLAAEQLCYLYSVNHGVPATSVRYFTVYGPRQRPDMGFHRFFSAVLRGPADHGVRRRRADARLHLRGRRGERHDRRRPSAACPAASTTSAAARASASTTCSTSSGA